MRPVRLSPVTWIVVILGVAVGGLALIQRLLETSPGRLLAEMVVSLYLWTCLYCVLQFLVIAWCSRRGVPRRQHEPRSAIDATWYLPLYAWGIESNINLASSFAGDGWPCFVAVQQCVMLLVTLGVCLAAESWARKRGLPARRALGALPLPVVAAIISVETPWVLFALPQLYMRW
jgi:hypothetical protein